MLDSFPVSVVVGTILGFLSGLGIGGGSLLIIWLTLVVGMVPESARIINLLFFVPSAVIAICYRRKQGTVNRKIVFPAVIAGCAAAAGFSLLKLDTTLLKKLFGGLLIVTGVRELLYKPKRPT